MAVSAVCRQVVTKLHSENTYNHLWLIRGGKPFPDFEQYAVNVFQTSKSNFLFWRAKWFDYYIVRIIKSSTLSKVQILRIKPNKKWYKQNMDVSRRLLGKWWFLIYLILYDLFSLNHDKKILKISNHNKITQFYNQQLLMNTFHELKFNSISWQLHSLSIFCATMSWTLQNEIKWKKKFNQIKFIIEFALRIVGRTCRRRAHLNSSQIKLFNEQYSRYSYFTCTQFHDANVSKTHFFTATSPSATAKIAVSWNTVPFLIPRLTALI